MHSTQYKHDVLEFCKQAGNTIRKAAEIFKISTNTICSWKKLLKETGSLEKKKIVRKEKKISIKELESMLKERPDMLQREMASHFGVARSSIQKALKKLGYKRKKKTTLYRERNEEKRKEYQEAIADIPKDSMVFVDESGINEFLYREHCYAPRGVKVIGEVAGKKFKRTNIIAGYINGATIAELVYDFNADKSFIEQWVEECLLKELKPGQTVIMDNASIHKSEKIEKLIKDAGCRLIFLPPYSPDLNPIEHFWANLKRYLRNVAATYDTLWDAIVSYFKLVSAC